MAGIAVGAGGGDGEVATTRTIPEEVAPPEQAVSQAEEMPLERQVGEILMIAFSGTRAPGYVQRALRQGRASGVILFRANAPSPASTRALTRRLQRASGDRALIAVDQEGGQIRILPWASPKPSQASQPTPAEARGQARAAARDLHKAGVNVNLAPVADVGGSGSVMAGRAFPGGTDAVATLTRAAVRGYRDTGVAATLKHFPGIGQAATNTDDEAVTIAAPGNAIRTRDLPPFEAGIDAGAPVVMAGHALYPALDPDNIASQSKPILTTLLRRDLGFKGVVITDSMEAAAVLDRDSIEQAALKAVAAGADLLLLTGPGSFPVVSRQLLTGARRSERFRARVAEAAARVIALKRSLGLRSG